MNKKYLVIFILVAIAVVLVFLISSRLYPIAVVQWQPIMYADLDESYSAALVYYQKAVLTYNTANADLMKSDEVKNEIRRAALESSIEDILVSDELDKKLGGSEAQAQVLRSVNTAISGTDIEKQTETLYGLSEKDFVSDFLVPQVRREILTARLRLENQLPNDNFDQWLTAAKQKASVMIFLPGFEWKDGTVAVKK